MSRQQTMGHLAMMVAPDFLPLSLSISPSGTTFWFSSHLPCSPSNPTSHTEYSVRKRATMCETDKAEAGNQQPRHVSSTGSMRALLFADISRPSLDPLWRPSSMQPVTGVDFRWIRFIFRRGQSLFSCSPLCNPYASPAGRRGPSRR